MGPGTFEIKQRNHRTIQNVRLTPDHLANTRIAILKRKQKDASDVPLLLCTD